MDNLNELKFLSQCVESKNIKRALAIIENVETCIHQNITTAETGKCVTSRILRDSSNIFPFLAFALQKLFNNTDGTLAFMTAISQNMNLNAKLFESCVKQLLKLYAEWIRDFTQAVQEYSVSILEVIIKFMKSSLVDAKTRELAGLVVHAMVEVKVLPDHEISNVLTMMLRSYNMSRDIKVLCECFYEFTETLILIVFFRRRRTSTFTNYWPHFKILSGNSGRTS